MVSEWSLPAGHKCSRRDGGYGKAGEVGMREIMRELPRGAIVFRIAPVQEAGARAVIVVLMVLLWHYQCHRHHQHLQHLQHLQQLQCSKQECCWCRQCHQRHLHPLLLQHPCQHTGSTRGLRHSRGKTGTDMSPPKHPRRAARSTRGPRRPRGKTGTDTSHPTEMPCDPLTVLMLNPGGDHCANLQGTLLGLEQH